MRRRLVIEGLALRFVFIKYMFVELIFGYEYQTETWSIKI